MATAESCPWEVGQQVDVKSRTWPGINKPGGIGHIVSIHYSNGGIVDSLDVTYIIGRRTDNYIDPDYVTLAALPERAGRMRRGRDFLKVGEPEPNVSCRLENPTDDKENAAPIKKQPAEKAKKKSSLADDKTRLDKKAALSQQPTLKPKKKPKKMELDISQKPTKKPKCKSRPDDAAKAAAPLKKMHKKAKLAADQNGKEFGVAQPPVLCSDEDRRLSIPKFVLTSEMAKGNTISPMDDDRPTSSYRRKAAAAISEEHDSPTGKSHSAEDEGTVGEPAKPPLRMTLKNVYEDKYQNATEFVIELVGTRDNNASVGTALEDRKQPAATQMNAEKSLGIAPDRLVLFVELFSELLRKNDMMIAEDQVCGEINRQLPVNAKTFTDKEVGICVTQLCDQNKAMKSDGLVYGI